MIRSSTCSLKFSNKGKLDSLNSFVDEYRNVCEQLIDLLWKIRKVPVLIPKEITSQVDTWLSARAVQCAAKQSSAIVRGVRKKHEQRLWRISQLMKEGKDASKLQRLAEKQKPSKPRINHICPELDARFVNFDFDNGTSFDGWLSLTSLGNKMKVVVPIKRHKHFNRWFEKGQLKKGVRISKRGVTFMFDCEPRKNYGKEKIGIDIGIKSVLSTSRGDQHGDLTEVNYKLSRRRSGSAGFRRAQQERQNLINQAVNCLSLESVKEILVENLKNIRKGRRTSRFLKHWTYPEIFDKLQRFCEEQDVLVTPKPYSYTSQRCSKCGWTRKSNRKGLVFKCSNCGYTTNADLNAAQNIALPLPAISKQQRLSKMNLKGFFWNEQGVYSPLCLKNSLCYNVIDE